MKDSITIEVWLYGPIRRYAHEISDEVVLDREIGSAHAKLIVQLREEDTVQELLDHLRIPSDEKGITFINGRLAAMPGVEADRSVVLEDGDRIGISHRRSMWPFQYRFGATLEDELEETFRRRRDRGIHHAYREAGE